LSDVADGFGGGKTRDRKLEIMRDSRIGTYGACALGISLLIRWSVLSEFAGPVQVFWALIAAQAASRALLGAFMHLLPPARADGLSADAGTVSAETAIAGVVLGAIALLALGLGGAVFALILLGLVFIAFRALCLNQIGGQTGDTVGALQQFGEIAILLVASVSIP
ncbi:adenosylcobinamide-GDP ribazoletransferase, partial [Mesorhizobium sp.]